MSSKQEKKYLTVVYDVKPGSTDAGDILIDPNVRYFFWSNNLEVKHSVVSVVSADDKQIVCSQQ